ncbi:hypothetical protein [Pseudomonas sp. NPDC089569]|uniref:BP74-related protein n=1 Tax=Pseudomonas sp. NPDC089569 TaxID=3390722 RepID=UPI003D0489EC
MGSVLFSVSDSKDSPPFIIRLDDPAVIEQARAILRGEETAKVRVQGTVITRQAPYNPAWSFHLDPGSISFFELAAEVCDASTQHVQENLDRVGHDFLPEGRWCPWSSRLVSELPAGSACGFQRPNKEQTSRVARELFAAFGLNMSPAGWVAGIDSALNSEADLLTGALQARTATMSERWADVYVQDIRGALASMESDLRYFDDLNYRLANQSIDIYAQDEALRIHNEEIAAGWYTVAAEIAQFEQTAAATQKTGSDVVKGIYDGLFANPDVVKAFRDPQQVANLRATTAAVMTYSPYSKLHDDFKTAGFLKWSNALNGNTVPTPLPVGHVGPDPMETPALVFTMTQQSALCEIAWAAVNSRSGQAGATANADACSNLASAKSRELQWAQADSNFRQERSAVQLQVRELRRQAVEQPGAPLNITEKCRTLRRRFVDQLAEAVARAMVVDTAMASVFGLPWNEAPPLPETWNDSAGSYLAALQRWFVRLDVQLARGQQQEVAQVVAVSIKQAAPTAFAKAVKDLKTNTAKTLSVRFPIAETLFGGLRGARIRGAFVSTIEKTPDASDSWQGVLSAPVTAVSIDASGRRQQIAQRLPPADAGRIQARSILKTPDLVGAAALRNASPIGDMTQAAADSQWLIEIGGKSLLGRSAADLTDIVVEIVVGGLNR